MTAIKKAMESDEWPKHSGDCEKVKNELREIDDVMTRSGQAIIPQTLRPKALWAAHIGHPGNSAMKSILKSKVWWPGMKSQAELWVKSCTACTLMSRRDKPMPMLRSKLQEAPWEELACDFSGRHANLGGIYILVIVDAYSRYLTAIVPVKTTGLDPTRNALVDLFRVFGKPSRIKTDNGLEWRTLLATLGIEALFSTPLDAQQNGGIERYMQTVNKGIESALVDKTNWRKSLNDAVTAHNSAVC